MFSRPHGPVVPNRRSPKATGFEPNLYLVSGLPLELQSILEDGFFKTTDQLASDALNFMEATGGGDMPHHLRNGWSRLIISVLRRSPEQIAALMQRVHEVLEGLLIRARADVGKGDVPALPEGASFDDFAEAIRERVKTVQWADLLQETIDSPKVGLHLSNMHRSLVDFNNSDLTLLTCDHPVVMTDGIALRNAFVFLPIGPRTLFVAANHADLRRRIEKLDPRQFMCNVNLAIVSQARRFVFGVDDRQLRFVENQMRRALAPPFGGHELKVSSL